MLDDGESATADDVYISYLTADKNESVIKEGKLTAGFGAQGRGPKIGPEYTFGFSMEKQLDEPILIIKAAWGGMVARDVYQNRSKPDGYDAYAEALAHFIRDVRKDFSAPEMPFVIGVMGTEGISTPETEAAKAPRYRGITPAFRAGMAKPATMLEFKGNFIAVETAPCWDEKLDRR